MRVHSVNSAFVATILSLTLGMACDESQPAGPEVRDEGLQFNFDGERSGGYESQGTPKVASGGLPEVGSWAIAHADSLEGMVVMGFEPTSDTGGDLFIVQLHPIGTGVFAPCDIQLGEGCHGRFIIGVDTQDLSAVDAWYEISEGTVTLSEAGPDRVRGTFSATFTNQAGKGTLTLNDGVIDVPFSQDVSLSNGLACLIENLRSGTNEPC